MPRPLGKCNSIMAMIDSAIHFFASFSILPGFIVDRLLLRIGVKY